MSGSIPVGPLPPLVSSTSVPLQSPMRLPVGGTSAPDGAAFRSLLASSPAPVAAATPTPCIDPAGPARMADLVPTARRLPVTPGPQAVGRILAGADVSMAAWPAPALGAASSAASGAAASAGQVEAVHPVGQVGLSAARRLMSSLL